MNCQDMVRTLDSRDVNALSTAERSSCEVHAASCPQCGADWVVQTRLAALPVPPMPQRLAMRCEALAAALPGDVARRRLPHWTIWPGALLLVAAAAAIVVARFQGASTGAPTSQGTLPAEEQRETAGASVVPRATTSRPDAAARPVTVQLVLEQLTGEAIGRDYGLRIHEQAREELRALPGVVLVDAVAPDDEADFRITYINLSAAQRSSSGLQVQVELIFEVEAHQPEAAGATRYRPVFRSSPPPPGVVDMPASVGEKQRVPSFDEEPWFLASSARVSPRPHVMPQVPADCLQWREDGCPYTPADIAAFTILSWHLHVTRPDPALVDRLHAMLRDPSSPPGLWLMALVNLQKHGKLRLSMAEMLAASGKIGDDDPALYAALMSDLLDAANRRDLMHELRKLLLIESPVAPSQADTVLRLRMVKLLGGELRNEPDAQAVLELVAGSDPDSQVRAEAKLAVGASGM